VGGRVAGLRRWVGANFAPLVLIALACVLIWVAIWKVWLPEPGAGAPSRRSAPLSLALLVLGVGAAVLAVFHERLASFQLDRSGVKVTLTPEQQAGAATLVDELGRRGAPRDAYPAALARYVEALATNGKVRGAAAGSAYDTLARRIAADVS
jgi:hypothetical protein